SCVHRSLHSSPTRRSSDLLHVGFPLGKIPSERLGRPDSILESFFGAAQFRRLFLQAASRFLNLFDRPTGLPPLPLELPGLGRQRSEEHTSELQSPYDLVCR